MRTYSVRGKERMVFQRITAAVSFFLFLHDRIRSSKAFAAGGILATGFIRVLPDPFESMTSPCVGGNPWGKFPFTGFVAMVLAIGTIIMEAFATAYQKRSELIKAQPVNANEESDGAHVHGPAFVSERSNSSDLIRISVKDSFSPRSLPLFHKFDRRRDYICN